MSRLTWEYGDKPDQIIIRKAKGKLTLDDIHAFMNEREQLLAFGEGVLCVIAWRTSADTYSGWETGKPEGDAADVFVLQDESTCFCGKVLHYQYCPECGCELNKKQ